MAHRPSVSVFMAAAQASGSLEESLDAIAIQDYDGPIEVLVAAADHETAAVALRAGVTVIDNPSGDTPSGLNRALGNAGGDILVRVDAHSVIPGNYVRRIVEVIEETGADVVGGMQRPEGRTFWERSIAAAMTSSLGSGGAGYRRATKSGPAETVYLGAFRRSLMEKLGGFNTSFWRNQDYEWNHRVIASGGTVWLASDLKVTYRPRGSLSALSRQYFQYGQAKRMFAAHYPGSLLVRQMLPPAVVVAMAVSFVGSLFWAPSLLVPAVYLAGLGVAGVIEALRVGLPGLGVPVALAVMHLCWGTGFLVGQRRAR